MLRFKHKACAVASMEIVLGSVQRRWVKISAWVICNTKDLLTCHKSEWVEKWAGFDTRYSVWEEGHKF